MELIKVPKKCECFLFCFLSLSWCGFCGNACVQMFGCFELVIGLFCLNFSAIGENNTSVSVMTNSNQITTQITTSIANSTHHHPVTVPTSVPVSYFYFLIHEFVELVCCFP